MDLNGEKRNGDREKRKHIQHISSHSHNKSLDDKAMGTDKVSKCVIIENKSRKLLYNQISFFSMRSVYGHVKFSNSLQVEEKICEYYSSGSSNPICLLFSFHEWL